MVDKIGQVIQPGAYLAYGHALGRCAGIRIGKVINLEETTRKTWGDRMETIYRITVIGVSDDWGFEKPSLCSRKGTLQHPNRTVVIAPELVPAAYKSLLDSV